MAPSPLEVRRRHNSLLFQQLLDLTKRTSPITLVLDTLEQGSQPVVREFARRAISFKTHITYISFTTLRKKIPFKVDTFISASHKPLAALRDEIVSHWPSLPKSTTATNKNVCLLIIDTLHPLCSLHANHVTSFLSSLVVSSSVPISLIATYHTDIPLPRSNSDDYTPSPLAALTFLATAILTVSSLSHILARKRARDRSLVEPVFGLEEQREGLLFGLKGSSKHETGVVVDMELRRRSGRGVVDNFVLIPPSSSSLSSRPQASSSETQFSLPPDIILLDDHPLYTTQLTSLTQSSTEGDETVETTFSLGLSDKQKRDREGVVLPYFDAQNGTGGEGGRILYEMGAEDREDFDDEEDEI